MTAISEKAFKQEIKGNKTSLNADLNGKRYLALQGLVMRSAKCLEWRELRFRRSSAPTWEVQKNVLYLLENYVIMTLISDRGLLATLPKGYARRLRLATYLGDLPRSTAALPTIVIFSRDVSALLLVLELFVKTPPILENTSSCITSQFWFKIRHTDITN